MYRVLVADGEFVTREALRMLIDAVDGFATIHAVGNGERAVELCCSDSVDIAFLAAVMPGLSGLDAARRIRVRVPSLPLALVTASDSAAFAREALQYNVNGYVTKPVSFAAVRDILLAHKASYAFESPALAAALRDVIASRDFFRAYAGIPSFVADILSRCGESVAGRRALLTRLGETLLASPGGELGGPERPLPVFDEPRLASPNGAALNLFEILEVVFRRGCLADYPVLGPTFSFIDASIEQKIGLEDIVGSAAASQTHVSRIFKKCFGLSVMDYLHLRKIHDAKMRFTYARQSVAEVAFALGYSEAGYFTKVFKKFENMTVQQYKASLS